MKTIIKTLSLLLYFCLVVSNVHAVKSDSVNPDDGWDSIASLAQPLIESELIPEDPVIRTLTEKTFPVKFPTPARIVFAGGVGYFFGFLATQQTPAVFEVGAAYLTNNTFLENVIPTPGSIEDTLLIVGICTAKGLPYMMFFNEKSHQLGQKVRRVFSRSSQEHLFDGPQFATNKIPHWLMFCAGSGTYLAQLVTVVNSLYTLYPVSSDWDFNYYRYAFLTTFLAAEFAVYAQTAFQNILNPLIPLRYSAQERETWLRQDWLDKREAERLKQIDALSNEELKKSYYQVHPDSGTANLIQLEEMDVEYLENSKRLNTLHPLPLFDDDTSRKLISWNDVVEFPLNVSGTVGDALCLQYMIENGWLGGNEPSDKIIAGVINSALLLAKLWCERGSLDPLAKTTRSGFFEISKTSKPVRAILGGISWFSSFIIPVGLGWYLDEFALPNLLGENAGTYAPYIVVPFMLKYWLISQQFNGPQFQTLWSRIIGGTGSLWEKVGFADKRGPLNVSLQKQLEECVKNKTEALSQLARKEFLKYLSLVNETLP